MKVAFCALAVALPVFAAGPRLTFIKLFPNSVPAYVSVKIERSGALEYAEAPADDHPVKAQLGDADTTTLFALAAKLDYFKSPLESGLKVANMGKKTFRYEDEKGVATETTFNYSEDPVARDLLERLERLASCERAYSELDRTVHFDKLGVNDALADIESLWLRGELAAPEQFIPLLTRIATHEAFMHLARDRAARLKDEFLARPAANVAPHTEAAN
jgi:hypothetical protein